MKNSKQKNSQTGTKKNYRSAQPPNSFVDPGIDSNITVGSISSSGGSK